MTDYFETMGIPIVKGRSFQPSDAASGPVVIVNETLVNTFWKDRDPIGQTLKPGLANSDRCLISASSASPRTSSRAASKRGPARSCISSSTRSRIAPPPISNAPGTMNIVLRTTLPPAALRTQIEAIVREADPSVPIVRLRDMNGVFEESITRPRLLAQLLGGFAGLALLLAAIGTYGVLSYMVAERRREIGIRMALGADQGSVLGQVMKQGLTLTTIGIVAGLAGALALNRLIASLLFGVQPTDADRRSSPSSPRSRSSRRSPAALPAWRASRVDPNVVLRDD